MRDQLAHRYFDASHAIIGHTVTHDLRELQRAVAQLLTATDDDSAGPPLNG